MRSGSRCIARTDSTPRTWPERLPTTEDAIALVRKRLCLAADRDDEIAEALGSRLGEHVGLWTAGPHEQAVVTLWWDISTSPDLEPYAEASVTTTVPTAP